MDKKIIKKIIITDCFGKSNEIPDSDIINIETKASVEKYCGSFTVILNNEDGKNSKIAEAKDEIEIWVGRNEKEIRKIMAGYIDAITLVKKDESGETVELEGRSYESFLLDKKITGKIEYTNGYSEVFREILKNSPFNLDEIQDSSGIGCLVFRDLPLIDLLRQLSEEISWVFKIDYDKNFLFKPDLKDTTHHHEITTDDLKNYRITKR